MAKNPAKSLTKGEFKSEVKLSQGDHMTDEAEVSCSFTLESLLPEGRGTSSGIMVRVHLPEGSINKDYAGAVKMARAEMASILRKMASQVVKGG